MMSRSGYRALADLAVKLHSAPTVVPLEFSQQLISRFDLPSEFVCEGGKVR